MQNGNTLHRPCPYRWHCIGLCKEETPVTKPPSMSCYTVMGLWILGSLQRNNNRSCKRTVCTIRSLTLNAFNILYMCFRRNPRNMTYTIKYNTIICYKAIVTLNAGPKTKVRLFESQICHLHESIKRETRGQLYICSFLCRLAAASGPRLGRVWPAGPK